MKKKPDNKETSLTRSPAAEYLTFITADGKNYGQAPKRWMPPVGRWLSVTQKL